MDCCRTAEDPAGSPAAIEHMSSLGLLLRCMPGVVAPKVMLLCLNGRTAAVNGTGHDCARQG